MIKAKKLQTFKYSSINPFTNNLLFETDCHSDAEVDLRLQKAHSYFQKTRRDGRLEVIRKFEKLQRLRGLM